MIWLQVTGETGAIDPDRMRSKDGRYQVNRLMVCEREAYEVWRTTEDPKKAFTLGLAKFLEGAQAIADAHLAKYPRGGLNP